MLNEAHIVERLASLERAVANLQQQFAASGTRDWLEKLTGSVSDEQAFDEALEYGRELRRSDPATSASDPE